jgi:protocatechuate 3,4-dioxygenase beta subunit
MNEADLTTEVLKRLDATPDPRLREIMRTLARHLHAFAREVRLTDEEWLAGIRFLTAVGQKCDDRRQEFILLSDTLGLSSLVETINHASEDGSTEATILGPFYVPDAPLRAFGESMVTWSGSSGQVAVLRGRVVSTDGAPLAGAVLDLWQTDPGGKYAVQRPDVMPPDHLRGRYRTDESGRYEVRTLRPVPYKVADDGPVGGLLRMTGRDAGRAAHIHAIVSADGYRPVTTHLFDRASTHLDSDTVFGVKDSLIADFVSQPDGSCVMEYDFVLSPGRR